MATAHECSALTWAGTVQNCQVGTAT